jgi:predicted dinucleotide-binding enzyme
MRIGIIGAGRIGGNAARLFAAAGHDVTVSFARDVARLRALGDEIGAAVGSPAEAARAEVVMLSVPWRLVPQALEQAGSLDDRIVIDTTNQYGAGGLEALPEGLTAAQVNQRRMPGARLVKAFNTLTAGFQASQAGRPAADRVVLFMCGDDEAAKEIVARLIRDAGFEPADVGGLADAAVMEAPRRPGSVYGEEYRPGDARAVVEAVRARRPIPPVPSYG